MEWVSLYEYRSCFTSKYHPPQPPHLPPPSASRHLRLSLAPLDQLSCALGRLIVGEWCWFFNLWLFVVEYWLSLLIADWCLLITLLLSVDGWMLIFYYGCWFWMLILNVDLECWSWMLILNVDFECWLYLRKVELGVGQRLSSDLSRVLPPLVLLAGFHRPLPSLHLYSDTKQAQTCEKEIASSYWTPS